MTREDYRRILCQVAFDPNIDLDARYTLARELQRTRKHRQVVDIPPDIARLLMRRKKKKERSA